MSIRFNADEVLRIAERAETNAENYYRKAAGMFPKQAEFLKKMADTEAGHRRIFAAMREKLPADMKEETAFDPYLEANMYLNAFSDGHAPEGSPVSAPVLTGKESAIDVLRIAIEMEQKGIVFYLGIMDMVPERLGKSQIQTVIDEEKSHFVTLALELKRLKG